MTPLGNISTSLCVCYLNKPKEKNNKNTCKQKMSTVELKFNCNGNIKLCIDKL